MAQQTGERAERAERAEAAQALVVMGRIGRPHGVKGWLRLQSSTSPPANILEFAELHVETEHGPGSLRIDGSRWQGDSLIVHFAGYDEPELARRLTGLEVYVVADELPELDAGEYYWRQLQGLAVVNLAGENLGRVSSVFETGANDVMVVAPAQGSIDDRERLIPYVWTRVVCRVDLEAGTINVDWGADFLA